MEVTDAFSHGWSQIKGYALTPFVIVGRPFCCLKVYESLTSVLRPVDPGQPNRLFLATIRSHSPDKTATLAHWIKNLFVKSGIDSNIFKPHSTRGAVSSIAARAGLSVSDVIRMVDCMVK